MSPRAPKSSKSLRFSLSRKPSNSSVLWPAREVLRPSNRPVNYPDNRWAELIIAVPPLHFMWSQAAAIVAVDSGITDFLEPHSLCQGARPSHGRRFGGTRGLRTHRPPNNATALPPESLSSSDVVE